MNIRNYKNEVKIKNPQRSILKPIKLEYLAAEPTGNHKVIFESSSQN